MAGLTSEQRDLCLKAAELEPLLSQRWTSFYNASELRTEIFAGTDTAPIMIMTDDISYADREFAVRAPQMLHAALAALRLRGETIDRLATENRQLKGEPKQKQSSLAQQCAIECAKPAFKKFLHEQHEVDIADQERVNTRVRTMLNIQSRAELDTDPEAARRWLDLRDRFKKWMKS